MLKKFNRYSKTKPSDKYDELISIYSSMHKHGIDSKENQSQKKFNSEKTFPGSQTLRHAHNIKLLIDEHMPTSMLDFGAGKAGHYHMPIADNKGNKFENLHKYWGIENIDTYEPALNQSMPNKKYDCVICTDVIEHIYFGDVFWTIREIFDLSKSFVYLNIACKPTVDHFLPNGENAHITVRSPEYWNGVLDAVSADFENIDYVLACSYRPPNEKTKYIFFRRKDLSKFKGYSVT